MKAINTNLIFTKKVDIDEMRLIISFNNFII